MVMDFTLRPSLERFAEIEIASQLWKANDTKKELRDFPLTYTNDVLDDINFEFYKQKEREKEILEMVSSKVNSLELTILVKKSLKVVVKCVGSEIMMSYHAIFFRNDSNSFPVPKFGETKPDFDVYLDRLSLTVWGKVDRWKTVQQYMGLNEDFDISQRYLWACNYCCGEYDDQLWNVWSAEMRHFVTRNAELLKSAEGNDFVFSGDFNNRKDDLTRFCTTRNNFYHNYENRSCMTSEVNGEGERISFQRLWSNLNEEKRILTVERIANASLGYSQVCCPEVLFFLVSRMDSQQQMTFFRLNPITILLHVLLDWQRRELFVPIVNLIGGFVSQHDVGWHFLLRVARVGNWIFGDVEECERMFQAAWTAFPHESKLGHENCVEKFLVVLVASENGRGMRLILNDATDEQNIKITDLLVHLMAFNPTYIQRGDFDLLDSFIREVRLNEQNISDLKRILADEVRNCYFEILVRQRDDWQRLLDNFVNWAFESNDEIVRYKRQVARDNEAVCSLWRNENNTSALERFVNWCFPHSTGNERFLVMAAILQSELAEFLSEGESDVDDMID